MVDGWILYFNYSKYIKELPKPNLSESEIKSRINEIEGCYYKKLSEKTALLCLSSFEHNYVDRIELRGESLRKTRDTQKNMETLN